MFEDLEFNPVIIGLDLVFSGIAWFFIWKTSIWATYPLPYKIILTIALPIVLYFVINWKIGSD